jgi:hypothetical protein
MRTKLMPVDVLFPTVRAALLKLLFGLPPRRFHVRELARRSGLTLSTVQQELYNLTMLGVLTNSSNGYHRHYAANSSHALFEALSQIVQMSGKLPSVSPAAMYRANRSRKKRVSRRVHGLSPNRPPSWEIFKRRSST